MTGPYFGDDELTFVDTPYAWNPTPGSYAEQLVSIAMPIKDWARVWKSVYGQSYDEAIREGICASEEDCIALDRAISRIKVVLAKVKARGKK
jgi:hypothetical protein